ncbi:HAD family hydrolase [Anaerofustis sp.]|uniref:HAD family hydrolase n=1 Tax=Anaerofustis sp. TaxID=1872517 RepID=UPI0025BD78BF|nr:HAD family hydrolase [Anaerofustis sp.]
MIKAAVFDFDGTLMDTLVDTANSINHVLKTHGFEEVPIEEYKNVFGGSCYDMINTVTPKSMNDPQLLHEMDVEVQYHYSKHYNENCTPYKNIRHALRALRKKGIDLCVITNKPSRLLIPLLNEFFGDIEFKHIIAADSGFPLKPNPASCNQLMQTLDIHHDEVVFIGDSEVDIQIAKNARAFSIGCGWGFRGGESLIKAGADYVIHEPMHVVEVVNILNKRSLKNIMDEAKLILKILK